MRGSVRRIINGGQPGAETGALRAARRLGIATGGFAPQGFRTAGGLRPELREWGLDELGTPDAATCLRVNIGAADAVLVLSVYADSPGVRRAETTAKGLGRPYLLLDPFQDGAAEFLRTFVARHRPQVLMVSGNRETVVPGAAAQVEELMVAALSD